MAGKLQLSATGWVLFYKLTEWVNNTIRDEKTGWGGMGALSFLG
jgi:hypothetical protein